MFDTLAEEVGAALRRAREARSLSLRDAARVSSGVFKVSTLASYERAQRTVPMERFLRLAFLYDISPVRLLADVLRRVEGRPSVRIDVRRVKSMGGVEAAILDGFIRNVFILRNQDVADTISLREGDLEVLATATGRRAHEFLGAIGRPRRRTRAFTSRVGGAWSLDCLRPLAPSQPLRLGSAESLGWRTRFHIQLARPSEQLGSDDLDPELSQLARMRATEREFANHWMAWASSAV